MPGQNLSSRDGSQEPNGCWLPSRASSPPVICRCGPSQTRFNTLDVSCIFLCFGVCRSCWFSVCGLCLDRCRKAIVRGADRESAVSLPCLCCDFCQCDCGSVASGQAGRQAGHFSLDCHAANTAQGEHQGPRHQEESMLKILLVSKLRIYFYTTSGVYNKPSVPT